MRSALLAHLARDHPGPGRRQAPPGPGDALPHGFQLYRPSPACNGTLRDAEKASVHGQLQDGTRRSYDTFAQCTDCGQAYWRGAHHARLNAIVDEAVREFGAQPSPPSADSALTCWSATSPDVGPVPRVAGAGARAAQVEGGASDMARVVEGGAG
ncbi:Mut7-C RNAse domain-containing protein [Streptantibioticus ferralitis]|uniref:Mut7-C RNAse domain-containing protein n=1 Tax=Streptantibioticus ferralitis TaxID=236510 RepID=UPI003378458F